MSAAELSRSAGVWLGLAPPADHGLVDDGKDDERQKRRADDAADDHGRQRTLHLAARRARQRHGNEAERCDRIGLMNKGRLIRVDTPVALRKSWAPYCFSVETKDKRGARRKLQTMPGVLASEPAGADLHVYLNPEGADSAQIQSELSGAGFAPVVFQPLDPSLEDVFIAAIAQEELRGQPTAA